MIQDIAARLDLKYDIKYTVGISSISRQRDIL